MTEVFYDRGIEFEFRESSEDQGDFVPAGKLLVAIRDHLRDGELEAATKLYQSCAQDLGGELVASLKMESSSLVRALGRMFQDARDFKRAARCYEHLGDRPRAARLYEQAQQFNEAAAEYVAAKEPGLAANMYLRADRPAEAARLYEESGDVVHAAEAHEQAGALLAAARAFAKAGAEPRAVAALQKVEVSSPDWGEARLLLGTVLARAGRLDLAARTLAEAVLRTPIAPPVATEIWFRLGHVYARLGDAARARFAYEKALALSPGYRDATQRIAALGAAAPPAASAQPPAETTRPAAPASPAHSDAGPPEPTGAPQPAGVATLLEGFEHLKSLPLARDLSLDDLRFVYAQCEQVEFEPGGTLIAQGKPGEALFIVRSGSVEVRVGGNVVARLGAGACVGEMSMVDDGPTSATVVAIDKVSAFRLGKDRFQRLLATNAGVALCVYRVFVETLVARLRVANEKLQAPS